MEWTVRIHRKARRFLEELPDNERRRVVEKIRELLEALNEGVLPYRRLDIRRLRGEWEGFLRLRVSDIRIIFRLDFEAKILYIYHIHRRGAVYKR